MQTQTNIRYKHKLEKAGLSLAIMYMSILIQHGLIISAVGVTPILRRVSIVPVLHRSKEMGQRRFGSATCVPPVRAQQHAGADSCVRTQDWIEAPSRERLL